MLPDFNPLEWGGVILYGIAACMALLVLCYVAETAWLRWIDRQAQRILDDAERGALDGWDGR